MLIAGLSFLASAQAPSITVVSREGRKPLPITTINNQDYVAVDDVNTAFGTTSREDRLAGGLTITARGRSIVLTENQNVVSVAGRLVSLPAPPLRRDGRWFVPADFLPRALAPALDTRLDLRRVGAAADRRRPARPARRGARRCRRRTTWRSPSTSRRTPRRASTRNRAG